MLSTPIKSAEVEGVLHNSPTPSAPSGSPAEPASENELPLIRRDLLQELPLIPWLHSVVTLSGAMVTLNDYTNAQELPQETPQELPLIPQDLTQELPLTSQELPPEIPQPLRQEASKALRLRLRLRLRELPPGQVKRMLIAHVRHCRNRWRCGTCRAARELLARRISSRQAVAS